MFGLFYGRSSEGRVNRDAVEDALKTPGEILLTVHGTFAADPANDGASWWQRGSAFNTRMRDATAPTLGGPPVVLPFHWSGANSEHDRMLAGRRLAVVMRRLEKARRPYHLLAHSHGGNVVVEALHRFTRVGRKMRHLRSVASFGTPYFRRRLKPLSKMFLLYRAVLLIGFLIASLLIVFGMPIVIVAAAIDPAIELDFFTGLGFAIILVGLYAAALVPTAFLWRSVVPPIRESARFRKAMTKTGLASRWLALWAHRDEAIGLLTRACAFSPKFIAPRGMARTLGRFSSFVAGLAILTVPLVVFFVDRDLYSQGARIAVNAESVFGLGPRVDQALNVAGFLFLWALPIFAVLHFTLSVLFRLGPQHVVAWIMNNTIINGLRTGVYGDDANFKLKGVGPTPERIEIATRELVDLDGVTAEDAVEAARAVYAELIELDPDGVERADPAGVWERLSQSIYHNSYFVDRAVLEATAGHVVANAGRGGGAAPPRPAGRGNGAYRGDGGDPAASGAEARASTEPA